MSAVALLRAQPAAVAVIAVTAYALSLAMVLILDNAHDAERRVLDSFRSPTARTIVVQDQDSEAGFHPETASRINNQTSIEWAVTMSTVTDQDWIIGDVTIAAGLSSRTADNTGPLHLTAGRSPRSGEAIINASLVTNQRPTGYILPSAGLATTSVPVVGFYDPPRGAEGLYPDIVIASDTQTAARIGLRVLPGTNTDLFASTIADLIQANNPTSITIATAANTEQLEAAIRGDLGRSNRHLVLALSAGNAILIGMSAAILIALRSRQIGLQRCLGATRAHVCLSTMAAFVTVSALSSTAGLITGILIAHTSAQTAPTGQIGPLLTTTTLATVVGVAPAALLATLRDPARVLRGT